MTTAAWPSFLSISATTDVYQPDIVWSAGLLRACQIAGEAQAAGAIYPPYTWGDGLVLLASLHVRAAVSTAPWIQYPYDPPAWTRERRNFGLPAPLWSDAMVTLSDALLWVVIEGELRQLHSFASFAAGKRS
jgi:L-alanine-DL-glutamate epimerase-like enolase superfamily enzyme